MGRKEDQAAAKREAAITALPADEQAEIRAIQARTAAKLSDAAPKVKSGKGLREPRTDAVDTGVQHGAPESAEALRHVEILGATQTGTIKIRLRGENGKLDRKATEVPGTLENLRIAVDQAAKRKLRNPDSIAERGALVATLKRRIRAAEAGPEILDAPNAGAAKGGREHGMLDGAALVKGGDLTGAKPAPAGRNGTMKGKVGREHVDRGAVNGTDAVTKHDREGNPVCKRFECSHVAGGRHGFKTYAELNGLSESQRNRYFKQVTARRKGAAKARRYQDRADALTSRFGELVGAAKFSGESGNSAMDVAFRKTSALMQPGAKRPYVSAGGNGGGHGYAPGMVNTARLK